MAEEEVVWGATMPVITTIAATVRIPVFMMNWFGGIAGVIWLLSIGDWRSIALGLGALVGGVYATAIALIPGVSLAALGFVAISKGRSASGLLLAFLGHVCISAVIVVWCVGALYVFLMRATPDTFLPLLLWSYVVGAGPWSYLAYRYRDSNSGVTSSITAFFVEIAFIVMIAMTYFYPFTIVEAGIAFAAVMAIPLVLNFLFTAKLVRESTGISVSWSARD